MNYYLTLALLLFVYMTAWFVVSLLKKRNDVADVAWGLGFVLLAWSSLVLEQTFFVRSLLVVMMVTIWGSRLAWHIHRRNKGKAEDFRYLAWRKEWGKWFYLRSYFQVYFLQGVLLFCVVMPVLVINSQPAQSLGFVELMGFVIWAIGFWFESTGDAELARFLKVPTNKGKLMQSGLWQYTRHPNYFGEVTQWWGIWVIAMAAPSGIIGIIGPLTITFLILKISGIPLLEKKMAEHPDFAQYKNRVSVFIPLPPRK
jgi:steroid 5-alpha reductase family enzyme